MADEQPQFDEETWAQLPAFFDRLPRPVQLDIWGDETGNPAEREAARLARTLSDRFDGIGHRLLPRRVNYPYYPVIGVMGLEEDEVVDYGLRIIGLPSGYQMTSLIAAIQCVSFQGMTSEATTRIQLHRLPPEAQITLELIAAVDDEAGALMAQMIFNMAVASPQVRGFLIIGDAFPEVYDRYSVRHVPHVVINGRVHVSGVVDEGSLVGHIVRAVRTESKK